jgi:hypothetical protein
MATQNGKKMKPEHDWWMYVWVGVAAGIFLTGLIKWWYCL